MKKNSKGGIASIIVVIIMVGLVLALIISTVVPMAQESRDTAQEGVQGFHDLQGMMGGGTTPAGGGGGAPAPTPDPSPVPPVYGGDETQI